jgi:hypothetical protein
MSALVDHFMQKLNPTLKFNGCEEIHGRARDVIQALMQQLDIMARIEEEEHIREHGLREPPEGSHGDRE